MTDRQTARRPVMVGLHQRAFDIEHESLSYSVAHGELADALAALPRRTLRLHITRNHRAIAPHDPADPLGQASSD